MIHSISWSSNIFHFVKDTYFRTLSSSSDDDYDSDDSGAKNDTSGSIGAAAAIKPPNPTGALINTTGPALTTSASLHSSTADSQKYVDSLSRKVRSKCFSPCLLEVRCAIHVNRLELVTVDLFSLFQLLFDIHIVLLSTTTSPP